MEIRLGWPDVFIRLWIPTSIAGWRYCLRNRKSFVIGVYGWSRFVEQRDTILRQSSELEDRRVLIAQKNERLKVLGKELSKFKRENPDLSKFYARIDQLEKELDDARSEGW